MHREWLEGGSLRLWLTDAEMDALGCTGEHAEEAAGQLLHAALTEAHRPTGGSWLIEALPVEGGCVLFCTPRKPRRLRLRRSSGPFVYALDDCDALLALAEAWKRRPAPLTASSVFLLDDSYRLILYPIGGQLPPPFVSEFADQLGHGAHTAAFVIEHGRPLAIGNALQQLAPP